MAKLQGKVARFLLIRPADDARRRRRQLRCPILPKKRLAVLLQLDYKRPEAEAMIRESLHVAPDVRDAERCSGKSIARTRMMKSR